MRDHGDIKRSPPPQKEHHPFSVLTASFCPKQPARAEMRFERSGEWPDADEGG